MNVKELALVMHAYEGALQKLKTIEENLEDVEEFKKGLFEKEWRAERTLLHRVVKGLGELHLHNDSRTQLSPTVQKYLDDLDDWVM